MNHTMSVVGLGYVGLPLALALAKHFPVIGFDIQEKRIAELQQGYDRSHEIDRERLTSSSMTFTTDPEQLRKSQIIIVCVPTPITKANKPDLSPLESASIIVGKNLSSGSIVVYESTVYPGVTEEFCLPLLEHHSGLRCPQDFSIGYSPERMNPGDKEHAIDKITKVVAGFDTETTEILASVYGKITTVHRAPAIKVAEAAKVIENIQRDLNIALMNELHLIFDKMGIETRAVLEAAGTKWNFHPYHPGLVGGHCIGVDPYYLTHRAEELGYHPQVILAGRQINDTMHSFYVRKIIQKLTAHGRSLAGGKVVILGVTFKPNVRDYRNSRVKHLIAELKEYGLEVLVVDPFVEPAVIEKEFQAKAITLDQLSTADLVLLAVNHHSFKETAAQLRQQKEPLFMDITFS